MQEYNFSTVNQSFDTAFTLWATATFVVSFIGSFFSCLVFLSIVCQPKLRTGSGALIGHVLILRFLTCAIHFPLFCVQACLAHAGVYLTVDCDAFAVAFIGFLHVEHWTDCFLSINRLIAILYPHRYAVWRSKNVVGSMIVVAWILGLCSTVPFFYGFGLEFRIANLGSCEPHVTDTGQALILLILGAFLPVGIRGILHTVICVRTTTCARSQWEPVQADHNNHSMTRTAKRSVVVARMLFASFIWYALCLLPIPVVLTGFQHVFDENIIVRFWLHFLILCGNAADPIIFLLMNGDYRTGVTRTISTAFS
ncbi:short-wave-sensitive opsin 1-like [Paramacrobiotus metropolitanus]|uniref:short-wave-sensitive opsin 1-like n=1 Tax=Paramacrobiotus metropolitanus TaxID=2943436 RepID=UPI0024460BF5|nr:short-wave-sensitive opsin 1-like [Paramacrobiotus metropolitanus]